MCNNQGLMFGVMFSRVRSRDCIFVRFDEAAVVDTAEHKTLILTPLPAPRARKERWTMSRTDTRPSTPAA